jgi:hypothetical protein
MPILASLGDAFDARNQLLQVLLGLLAVERRLATLVAPAAGDDGAPAPPADDAFTHLVLGLVAIGERLRAHLDAVAAPAADGAPLAVRPAAAARLRDLLV